MSLERQLMTRSARTAVIGLAHRIVKLGAPSALLDSLRVRGEAA